jgi:hypothetical protein
VPAAGVYTLYFRVDDSWVLWLGNGATLVAAGINTANGSSASISGIASKSGLGAPLAGRMNRGLPVEPTDYVVVNFPTAGTYPFEMGWGNDSGNRYFMCTFAAGNLPSDESVNSVNWGSSILPVTPLPTPPKPPKTPPTRRSKYRNYSGVLQKSVCTTPEQFRQPQ